MRYLLFFTAAFLVTTSASAQETQELTVKLSPTEWNIIGDALANAPYKVAAPILGKLQKQLQPAAQAETQEKK